MVDLRQIVLMKRNLLFWSPSMIKSLSILLLLLLNSCTGRPGESAIVDATYVAANLNDEKVTIIDLRTPKEIKSTGTIPGAEVKDYLEGDFEDYVEKLDPKKEYIVYCKSGGRSAKAAQVMAKKGLKVKNFSGGMDNWSQREKK